MVVSVSNVIYENAQNNYRVVKYNVEQNPHPDIKDLSFVGVGYYIPTTKDITYEVEVHAIESKYGTQYEIDSFEEIMPVTKEGIIAYLSSPLIKGVGEKTALSLYNHFGTDTLRVMAEEPERLYNVTIKGLTKKKKDILLASYQQNRNAEKVVTFLAPFQVPVSTALRLYKERPDILEVIKTNPYQLCDIKGFGFTTVDAIARKLHQDMTSQERIRACMLYVLQENESGCLRYSSLGTGNLCMPMEEVVSVTTQYLATSEITRHQICQAGNNLIAAGQLTYYKGYVYRSVTNTVETTVADNILRIAAGPKRNVPELETWIKKAEGHLHLTLDEIQKQAITTAIREPLVIITGGPGTGKTTILQVLDYILTHACHQDICYMAPTGRAARRMTEAIHKDAYTIHRYLGLNIAEEEPRDIEEQVAVVDECSMVDIWVAHALFQSVLPNHELKLVGDIDQLPSVGPGAVLYDMIASHKVPVIRLTKLYRQGEGSTNDKNAKLIRQGYTNLHYDDTFHLLPANTHEECALVMEQEFAKALTVYSLDQIVCLCPFRKKHPSSADEMNPRLQKIANPKAPNKKELTYRGVIYREGDRVMHQNRNQEEVSNGDMGYIKTIQIEQEIVQVMYDNRCVTYTKDQLENLTLAYATTVHKSQGSEFECVITMLTKACYHMMTRNLFYTAITRAKKQCIVVGQKQAIAMAIKTPDTKRLTMLQDKLTE